MTVEILKTLDLNSVSSLNLRTAQYLCKIGPSQYTVTWADNSVYEIPYTLFKEILNSNRNRLTLADPEAGYFTFDQQARYEGTWSCERGGRYFHIDQRGNRVEIDLDTYNIATDSHYPTRHGNLSVVSPLAKG